MRIRNEDYRNRRHMRSHTIDATGTNRYNTDLGYETQNL